MKRIVLGLAALALAACGNQPPVASAGSDFTVSAGERTFLDSSASTDPEGDPLTAEWSQVEGDPVSITINSELLPEFRAPFQSNTFLKFKVKVSDGHSFDEATVIVSVGGSGNRTPVVTAGSDRTVTRASTVTLNGDASDPNGDALTYKWEQTLGPPVTLADPTAVDTTFTAPDEVTDLAFRLTATDGSRRGVDSVAIHVVN